MDIRTKRIAKTAALGAVKMFLIGSGIVAMATALFYVSVVLTGQAWPIMLIAAFIFFCIAAWDWARLKVETEMREEERLMRILGQKQDH